MAVLTILFVSWLVLRGIGALGVAGLSTWQHSACYALAVMFVVTGIAHFNRMKHDLARMVPAMFPRPLLLVYFTGILEFMGAIGLLLPRFRSLAGACLIALMIVLFPANVNAAMKRTTLAGKPATPLWLRTPMQILFVGLLWWSTRA
ncbi:MAG: DoxX family protein [Terriglobales bacterium]